MTRKSRILIVDDDEILRDALKLWLENKGFIVYTASDPEEAMTIAVKEWLHLAVIDIRFVKGFVSEDRGGFDLAKKMEATLPKIFLTVFEDFQLALDGLSQDMKKDANVVAFVTKSAGEEKLLEEIQKALSSLNSELEIHWGKYSPRMLIEMLKAFRSRPDEEVKAAEAELEDLFCRLFDQAKSIELVDLKVGKGGCAVLRITPIVTGGKGADVIVKFGPRETIMREWRNYEKWVKKFVPHGRTVVNGSPAQTLHLGAIEYSFVGGSVIAGAFSSYYQSASVEKINQSLRYLFGETCGKWYENRREPQEEKERLPLDLWYRKHELLNLADTKHVQELETIFEQLLDRASSPSALYFQLNGEDSLKVSLDSPPQIFPNPLHVALREKYGEEKAAPLYPLSSLVAITHGDLNGENILLDRDGNTFLIDFYKTEPGPVFRDFAELESIIKFELVQSNRLLARYNLEKAILAPRLLSSPLETTNFAHDEELTKAALTIQNLRYLAAEIIAPSEINEYYVALLFYALKEMVGFSSGADRQSGCTVQQYHALLSAAMICKRLIEESPFEKDGKKPRRVFLSYARTDEEQVKELHNRLTDAGFDAWMDSENLVGGEQWAYSIEKAIEGSVVFLACLTENSVNRRGELQKEIRMALDVSRGLLETDIFTIPVHLQECTLPESLKAFHSVDLFKEDGWNKLVKAIEEAIKRRDE